MERTLNQDVLTYNGSNPLSKLYYHYTLWTGIYMLTPMERAFANIVTCVGVGLWFAYVLTFLNGVISGIMEV
ncbi:hypothetical protein TrRE_jg10113 [Triparma retinervis]|uniref:Uncharacterized protein n=1 Tax=Triparma retinervis TaxID=2557542 RepID=A0A9W6ZCN1_9STRA|nr:hypothetical protein TrRE_jg10113 [Triparma retinervis]